MELLGYQFKEEIRELIRAEIAATAPVSVQVQESPVVLTNQRGLCEFLSLSEPTIIRWRNKGKIPFLKVGSAIRYDLNAVAKALESSSKKKGAIK
jgi:excisionase family DNA binding protein